MSGSLSRPWSKPVSLGKAERSLAARIGAYARSHAAITTVLAAMVAWDAVLFLLVRRRFLEFRLPRYDLGNMVQAVWNTAHGHPLEITNGTTGEQMVRLGSHVDPILAALAPLWVLAPTPLLLVAVQVVAVGLGALPVFWLARRHLESERAATFVALTYLAYPWTAWAACDVFHPVTLAIPGFLFCIWFLDTRRFGAFSGCAVLVLGTGELMGLPLGALGIWYAVTRRAWRSGAAIAGVGFGWTLFALYVVVPHFSGASSAFYGAFEDAGGSPSGIARTAVTDPLALLAVVAGGNHLVYVLVLAAPLGGAFLLAPGMAAVALPALGVNLLSDFSAMTYPHLHYVAGVVPFLIAAVAIGIGRLRAARIHVATLVLVLSLVGAVAAGPWPGQLGAAPDWYWGSQVPASRVAALTRATAISPDRARVATTNRLGAHLSARRYVYSLPAISSAQWVVIDSSDTWVPRRIGGTVDADALRALRARLERAPHWSKVFDEQGVLVFRRLGT